MGDYKGGDIMFQLEKSIQTMPMNKYFEIVNPKYTIYKITPHSSCRNYNTSSIASVMSTIKNSIRKEDKKYFIESKMKCAYMIDVYKQDVKFYFIVPQQFKLILRDKLEQSWSKATIEEVEFVNGFDANSILYEIKYKNNDALSLTVDKKSNTLLNNLLNVVEVMEEDDRVTILYNFTHANNWGWQTKSEKIHDKWMQNIKVPKTATKGSIAFEIFCYVLEFIERFIDELMGERLKDINPISELNDALRQKTRKLSQESINKKNDIVLNTQIGVISSSKNQVRANNNALIACQSFYSLKGDNEFTYEKKVSCRITPYDTNIHTTTNKIGVNESSAIIQIPGKELLDKHKISHVNVTEIQIPEQLQKGYLWIGKNTYKGHTIDTYLSNEPNINNLPLVPMGQMGSGKTTLLGGIASNVVENTNEGVIVIDFIKKCELSDYIRKHTPKDRLIDIDLSIPEQRQSFCYNEIDVSKCKTLDEIVDTASLLAQETMRLIDSVNTEGEPLKPKMRRYLSSACNVVFTYPNTTLKDVVQCLENHEKRHKYIKGLGDGLTNVLDEEINNLFALDEVKDGNVIGTKDGKIEGVLDRINLLKEDSKLKYMFNMSPKNNINFVDAMNQGKVILIKMPQAKFSRYHRNILTTFFISKVWLACTIRGDEQDKPLRNHLIVDEIFDAPTSFNVLCDMLVQVRKFQLKLIFSAHYLSQIEPIREALKASGASYMLLQGTDKKNYKELESELQPFTVDDLINLKQYHSLNLIKYSKGYAKFISDLTVKI